MVCQVGLGKLPADFGGENLLAELLDVLARRVDLQPPVLEASVVSGHRRGPARVVGAGVGLRPVVAGRRALGGAQVRPAERDRDARRDRGRDVGDDAQLGRAPLGSLGVLLVHPAPRHRVEGTLFSGADALKAGVVVQPQLRRLLTLDQRGVSGHGLFDALGLHRPDRLQQPGLMRAPQQTDLLPVPLLQGAEKGGAEAAHVAAELHRFLEQRAEAVVGRRRVEAGQQRVKAQAGGCRAHHQGGVDRRGVEGKRPGLTGEVHAVADLEQAVLDRVPESEQHVVGGKGEEQQRVRRAPRLRRRPRHRLHSTFEFGMRDRGVDDDGPAGHSRPRAPGRRPAGDGGDEGGEQIER